MKQQYTIGLIHRFCKPRFNHEYALSRLKAEGYKLAVGSNSIRQTVRLMMEKAKLIQYFDLILSNQDVRHAKPSPEIYLTAMERLGVRPEECVIVEDNENGIRAAIDSGGYVLPVKTVDDVTYENIMTRIHEVEEGAS